MDTLAPLIKYPGGKTWALGIVAELYEPFRDYRWVDPFAGGAGLPIALQPKSALLCDLNPYLVRLYQWVQEVGRRAIGFENTSEFFYQARAAFNRYKALGELKWWSAEMLYLLLRHGFNGLCRFNKDGNLTISFGDGCPALIADFSPYRRLFESWTFRSGDFTRIELEPTDFLFVDPPYDGEGFTSYFGRDFTWERQVEVAQWAKNHLGPVVLFNKATERILGLYHSHGFETQIISAPRRIACNGDRAAVQEVIATRNLERHAKA